VEQVWGSWRHSRRIQFLKDFRGHSLVSQIPEIRRVRINRGRVIKSLRASPEMERNLTGSSSYLRRAEIRSADLIWQSEKYLISCCGIKDGLAAQSGMDRF
jgi:hypothetical protein